jgi:hypothetical protein
MPLELLDIVRRVGTERERGEDVVQLRTVADV